MTTEMNFLVLESNYDCSDLFEILLAHIYIRDISRKTTYCIEKRSRYCTCTLYNRYTLYVNHFKILFKILKKWIYYVCASYHP